MENFYQRSSVINISTRPLDQVPDGAPYIIAYFHDEQMFWSVEGATQSQVALLATELIRNGGK